MSPRKHSVLAAPLFSASTLGRWTWKGGTASRGRTGGFSVADPFVWSAQKSRQTHTARGCRLLRVGGGVFPQPAVRFCYMSLCTNLQRQTMQSSRRILVYSLRLKSLLQVFCAVFGVDESRWASGAADGRLLLTPPAWTGRRNPGLVLLELRLSWAMVYFGSSTFCRRVLVVTFTPQRLALEYEMGGAWSCRRNRPQFFTKSRVIWVRKVVRNVDGRKDHLMDPNGKL